MNGVRKTLQDGIETLWEASRSGYCRHQLLRHAVNEDAALVDGAVVEPVNRHDDELSSIFRGRPCVPSVASGGLTQAEAELRAVKRAVKRGPEQAVNEVLRSEGGTHMAAADCDIPTDPSACQVTVRYVGPDFELDSFGICRAFEPRRAAEIIPTDIHASRIPNRATGPETVVVVAGGILATALVAHISGQIINNGMNRTVHSAPSGRR